MNKVQFPFLTLLLIVSAQLSNGQTLTGLELNFSGSFDNSKSIYISPMPEDKLKAVDKLKYSLFSKGMKTVATMGDAEYLITFSYKDRQDNGCKRTFKEMSGTVMDIENTGGVIADFKFNQTGWEGNCVDAVFNDLADRFKGHQSSSATSKKSNSAKTNLTMNDVYSTTELVFYGFDFTNFRFIDEKYLNKGAEIRDSYFSSWNSFPLTEIPIDKMQKWFKKNKITYNPVNITILNSKVSSDNIVQTTPFTLSLNAIKETISKFDKPNNSTAKIGYIVDVEFFNKETKRTSAYVTFFDISTGAIISSENIINKEAGGNGLTTYWGKSLSFIIREYYDQIYSKGQK